MIKHFEEIDSTSKYIKENVEQFSNLDIVSADYQSLGKGRNDHVWSSKKGENILLSTLIKEENIISSYSKLSIYVGVTIYKFLLNYLPRKSIQLKWPNDVYVNDKKICGILLEGKLPEYIVIGIGLNINQKEFGELQATSLSNEVDYQFKLEDVRKLFCLHLIKQLSDFENNVDEYLKIFNQNNYLKNKQVTAGYVNENGELINGIAQDINEDGSLQILSDNKIIKIYYDEVKLIK